MKKILLLLALLALLCGCAAPRPDGPMVAATTYPVAQFTEAVCAGTGVAVRRVISDPVSCVHDYSLSVGQMKTIEQADMVILSGVELEAFMDDALSAAARVLDASNGVPLLEADGDHDHGAHDPHIWLSPDNAAIMVQNIADGLSALYPAHAAQFRENAAACCAELADLAAYGRETLASLPRRELVTFHDGFSYFADAFDLTILAAIEEEAGAETSAKELAQIVRLVRDHDLPAIFTETNGSDAAAGVVSRETGCAVRTLDLGMGELPYLDAMRQNIDLIAEVLS